MLESIHFPCSLNLTFIYNLSRILNKKNFSDYVRVFGRVNYSGV